MREKKGKNKPSKTDKPAIDELLDEDDEVEEEDEGAAFRKDAEELRDSELKSFMSQKSKGWVHIF